MEVDRSKLYLGVNVSYSIWREISQLIPRTQRNHERFVDCIFKQVEQTLV